MLDPRCELSHSANPVPRHPALVGGGARICTVGAFSVDLLSFHEMQLQTCLCKLPLLKGLVLPLSHKCFSDIRCSQSSVKK